MILHRNRAAKDQLEAAFERVNRLDESEFELKADFARYLCVQVSGFLEQSVRNATTDYATKRSDPTVANFVLRATNRLTNLDSDKIKDHLLKFNPGWRQQLDALLIDEKKDAINSVVALRHMIAHGQSADVTVGRIKGYFWHINKVIDGIEKMLD